MAADHSLSPEERLIVALDLPTADEARQLVRTLGNVVSFYKIGLELLFRGGIDLVKELKDKDKKVFLDYKFWDIERTVNAAIKGVLAASVDFVTVHADEPTLNGAVLARADSGLKILGVVLLSSLADTDVSNMGIERPDQYVSARIKNVFKCGGDGIVISGSNVKISRDIANRIGAENLIVVVPGIRPAGADWNDQKRVLTPGKAIEDGADYLVVGRPIRNAENVVDAACGIIKEIEGAMNRPDRQNRQRVGQGS
jgi:orotidine-5'-phosphate decarboxylase